MRGGGRVCTLQGLYSLSEPYCGRGVVREAKRVQFPPYVAQSNARGGTRSVEPFGRFAVRFLSHGRSRHESHPTRGAGTRKVRTACALNSCPSALWGLDKR